MKHRLISVIVPIHSPAKCYLSEALGSLRAQSWTTWECVCIDDGDCASSADIVADFIRGDSRFRMVCQRNTGISGARNRGLDVIRGDAFMHMDQDDVMHHEAMARMETCARRLHVPLVSGRCRNFTDDLPNPGAPLPEGEGFFDRGAMRAAVLRIIRLVDADGWRIPSWNRLYDRKTFGHIRFFPSGFGDDCYYTPRIFLHAPSGALLTGETYFWRCGHVSGSNKTCTLAWVCGYCRAILAASRLDSGKDYLVAWKVIVGWVLHSVFYGWIVSGKVWHDPEAARTLAHEVGRLLDLRRCLSLKWRLRLWFVRNGWWRMARASFIHAGKPKKCYQGLMTKTASAATSRTMRE